MAGVYLKIYDRFPEFLKRRINPLEYALRRFVQRAAEFHAGGRVLDAGAGESRFRSYFERHRYIAVDSTVGEAEWDYSRIDFQAELSCLPVKSGSFDAVLNTQVLEHVSHPDEVIGELQRVLKPGGRLYLSAPQGWPEHQQPHDFYRFTRFSLEKLLREAGFSKVVIEPMGGYFHYMGQRSTYLPKVLFSNLGGVARVVLLPLELLSLAAFCFAIPILCFYLDRLDRKKEFTLIYGCEAEKG